MAAVNFFSLVLFVSVFLTADALVFKDCGSLYGKIRSVAVDGCENTPRCILKSGTNTSIQVSFTALEDTSSAKAVVHGIIGGVPLPFPLPQSNACENSGLTCPLVNGNLYGYYASIPVSTSYPKIKVVVRWQLIEASGKNMFCIEIPAAIM